VPDRRWGACGAGLEVGEDGRDHPRVGDDGERSQCCTAARATGDVDVEHPAQALSPCHLRASGRRPRVGTLARRRARRRGPDEAAMARVWGKQAVEPKQVTARARHRRSQAGDEVERLEQDVGGAVAKRMLQLVDHQPVTVAAETLTRNGPVSASLARKPARRASTVDRALVTTASTRVSSSGRAANSRRARAGPASPVRVHRAEGLARALPRRPRSAGWSRGCSAGATADSRSTSGSASVRPTPRAGATWCGSHAPPAVLPRHKDVLIPRRVEFLYTRPRSPSRVATP